MFELTLIRLLFADLRDRLSVLAPPDDDRGSTENIIWIALGAAMAIALIAIVAAKLTAKANSINLG